MSVDLSVAQIDRILEELDAKATDGQLAADVSLLPLENGCTPEVDAHVKRYLSDPEYAQKVVVQAQQVYALPAVSSRIVS